MAFVEFHTVSKSYKGRPAVRDFSLEVEKGDRLAILGSSGCGKTTVLRLLAGLVVPDAGSIAINGELVSQGGRIIQEPERRNIGMVFQDLALWPHLTVEGNLRFGLNARGVPRKVRNDRIREMLRLTQLEAYARAKPAELSGGQQQRVALARALVLEPRIVLMDEPLSSLNIELSIQLRREILRLQKQFGFTLLYVTHNREEAFDIGARVLVMEDGRVVRIGSVAEIKSCLSSEMAARQAEG